MKRILINYKIILYRGTYSYCKYKILITFYPCYC